MVLNIPVKFNENITNRKLQIGYEHMTRITIYICTLFKRPKLQQQETIAMALVFGMSSHNGKQFCIVL